MPSDLPRYTLRVPQEYLEKIRYIADENGRSANREIEMLLKKRIDEYEAIKGKIELSASN